MTGRRHGQELGKALDEPQDEGDQRGHPGSILPAAAIPGIGALVGKPRFVGKALPIEGHSQVEVRPLVLRSQPHRPHLTTL